MEEDPFCDLQISSFEFLHSIKERSFCPQCGKSRKYYCYTCYVPVATLQNKVPKVKLPVKIDIIKHPNEIDGKSTAAHAAVIAPDDVTVYIYPTVPDYKDKSKVILVYPCDQSMTLADYIEKCCSLVTESVTDSVQPSTGTGQVPSNDELQSNLDSSKSDTASETINSLHAGTVPDCRTGDAQDAESSSIKTSSRTHTGLLTPDCCQQTAEDQTKLSAVEEDRSMLKRKHSNDESDDSSVSGLGKKRNVSRKPRCPFHTVVFIDSTWPQAHKIFIDERLKDLQRVELKSHPTRFWRHQRHKPSTYLATVEAVYYLLCEYHQLCEETSYSGQYDNLLFFFCFMYQKIRYLYDGGRELMAYQKNAD